MCVGREVSENNFKSLEKDAEKVHMASILKMSILDPKCRNFGYLGAFYMFLDSQQFQRRSTHSNEDTCTHTRIIYLKSKRVVVLLKNC